MFWFWNKNTAELTNFDSTINTVKSFLWTKEWEKARNTLHELREKEKTAYETSLKDVTDESKKADLLNQFNQKNTTIDTIEAELQKNEEASKISLPPETPASEKSQETPTVQKPQESTPSENTQETPISQIPQEGTTPTSTPTPKPNTSLFSFWNKKVDYEKIHSFWDAVKAIKILLWTKEWEKARNAIAEIREKEKGSYNASIKELTDENEKLKLKKEFDNNSRTIDILEAKLKVKEQIDKDAQAQELFKLKYKKIKEEINTLSKSNRLQEALLLLSSFFEENKGNLAVVKFFDTEKKKIMKLMDAERKREEAKLKQNAETEAMKLVGETLEKKEIKDEDNQEEKKWGTFDLFSPVKAWLKMYSTITEWLQKKKLIDEVTKLIEVENQVNMEVARNKLEKIHQWLIKELSVSNIEWYEFFWKILGADRITGDTFWFQDEKEKYDFFLWDATGHWVKAGLIVSLLSRLFSKYVAWSYLTKLVMEINNWLKQDLQSRNFITGIFFEISKSDINRIRFVGMGHEPILVYRAKEKKVERMIPWWLAAGIRIIKDEVSVKEKDIVMESDDILVCYSDGIVEARNVESVLYWVDKIQESLQKVAPIEKNLGKIYSFLIDEVKAFHGGSKFDDDATIIILRKNDAKDIIKKNDNYLDEVAKKEGLGKFAMRKFVGKTKEEVEKELEKIRKQKELESIIKNLETLYYTGEILKLKQEAIRFIKAGFIHKKINFYLKKAIANENVYKIEQKNKKIAARYSVLQELLKKWDYSSVIKDCNEIIAKEWNI